VKETVHEETATAPEPDRLTVVRVPGTPPVFEDIVKEPLKEPTAVGANLTAIVQVPAGAIESPLLHVVDTML
jgi:hypothetical protein